MDIYNYLKKHIFSVTVAFLLICISPVCFAVNMGDSADFSDQYLRDMLFDVTTPPLLVDDAGLLSDDQNSELLFNLERISNEYECDVAIITVSSLDGYSSDSFADDYFDYNGYGYGESFSGILFLVSTEHRDWAISTYGKAFDIFNDYNQEKLMEKVLNYLSDDMYYEGFCEFAFYCEELLKTHNQGGVVVSDNYFYNTEKTQVISLETIAVSVAIGVVTAFIIVLIMKMQLKSVKPNDRANEYIRNGSFTVTGQRDIFLYRNIIRTAKPKNNNSGSRGHSSSRTGSSGRPHGGSRGKF